MEVTKLHDDYVIKQKHPVPNEIKFCCSTKFGPSVVVTCQALIFSLVFEGEIVLEVTQANKNWEQLCYRYFDNKTKSYFFRDPWRSWIKASSLSELKQVNEQFDHMSRNALTEAKCLVLV